MCAVGADLPWGLVLRDAQPHEVDDVAALLGDVYGVFRDRLPADAWSRYIGEIVDVAARMRGSELIVAESGGGIVGTIALYPAASGATLGYWPGRWGSIRTLAVGAEARRQGIGGTLARECVDRAQQHGGRAIGLHTASHLADATRLYKRLGFRRAPEFDIEIGEMFGGRRLSPAVSWQAQAYRVDLKGAMR